MLKGTTEIILTDVVTGEVTRTSDDNMFTNALDNVFNSSPYYFNNALLQKFYQVNDELLTPVYNKALGGLLLFPETITEDADTFYAPASNKPTGIASNDAYAGEDTRRGSFNEVESGDIIEGGKKKGYRFVWDFNTAQANGKISCACLTSAKGGEGYLDGSSTFLHHSNLSSVANIVGFYHSNGGNITDADTEERPRGMMIGADDSGIYFYRYSNSSIYRFAVRNDTIELLLNPTSYEKLFTVSSSENGAWTVANGFVYRVRTNGNSSGNASVIIDKYDPNNDWNVSSQTINVVAQLKRTENTRSVAILNGYLYMNGYDNVSVFKINLSNIADVTKIVTGVDGRNMGALGHLVACKDFIIESDDTVHSINSIANPIALSGCWAIMGQGWYSTGAQLIFGATIFTPYLGTINNLRTAVTKDASKTMKIVYSVRES